MGHHFTPEELKGVWERAKRYARKWIRDEGSREDFASWLVEEILRKNLETVNFRCQLVDYMRLTLGRPNLKKPFKKGKPALSIEDFENLPAEIKQELNWVEIIEAAKLERQERLVFMLVYKWGFTYAEIGELLGCDQSWIHVVKARGLKRVLPKLAELDRSNIR